MCATETAILYNLQYSKVSKSSPQGSNLGGQLTGCSYLHKPHRILLPDENVGTQFKHTEKEDASCNRIKLVREYYGIFRAKLKFP